MFLSTYFWIFTAVIYKGLEGKGLEFLPTLPRAFVMEKSVSAIIAQAAAMGKALKD